jgi:hypothetical protein
VSKARNIPGKSGWKNFVFLFRVAFFFSHFFFAFSSLLPFQIPILHQKMEIDHTLFTELAHFRSSRAKEHKRIVAAIDSLMLLLKKNVNILSSSQFLFSSSLVFIFYVIYSKLNSLTPMLSLLC